MTQDAPPSIDAIALLRISDWDPPEDLDVRLLDDGALVFLSVPFATPPEHILEALAGEVGEALHHHDDERGIFVVPDSAEPDDAETYDAVIASVGDAGAWIALDVPPPDLASLLGGDGQGMFAQALGALGIDDPQAFMNAMQSGDADAMKVAQIKMQSKLEEAMRAVQERAPNEDAAKHEAPEAKKLKPP